MAQAPEGTKWCKQCKKFLPADQFLVFANRRVRVVGCNSCARKNMAAYDSMRRAASSKPTGDLLKNLKAIDD